MATSFEIKGFEAIGKMGERLNKEVQKQVDAASKLGINKTADLVTYGRVSAPKPTNLKADSAVALAAKALRIPVEHVFYRTFVQGIKISAGRGRGGKPFASVMMRGNGINIADLLYTGDAAKQLYGFQSRKRKVSGKKRGDITSKAIASRSGRGKVKIGGKTYSGFIQDGKRRIGREKYYVEKLGATLGKGLKGKRFLLMQKKDANQKLPYPVKVVKINSTRVLRALNAASKRAVATYASKITDLQSKEVNKRLKKLGFELK